MSYELTAEKRNVSGSSQARRLRHTGLVPGIIFGAGKDPLSISISERALNGECNTSAFFNRVFTLNIDGKQEKVLPKEISRHPVTGNLLHVDFMRIAKGTKIKIFVPVETVNDDKSPGVKKGGIINLVVHRLECLCDPEMIPEKITLDLTGKEIGDSFILTEISLPQGVSAVNTERDNVLATIVTSKVGKEEETQASVTTTTTTTEATATKSE